MKHKIKVVMLPTEDKTHIFQCRNGQILYAENTGTNTSFSTYIHLYITVSQDVEPIKDGDWFYNSFSDNQPKIQQRKGNWRQCFNQKKIISTTDPKLTIFNTIDDKTLYIPQVQQSFLKEFVANPDGEYKIEYETKDMGHCTIKYDRYLTILKLNQDNTVNITSVKEKMYSRREVLLLLHDLSRHLSPNNTTIDLTDWIKENL
jgi:hypothetical protein